MLTSNLTIKREEHGHVIGKFLHDMLMTGQTVSINGPAGRFHVRSEVGRGHHAHRRRCGHHAVDVDRARPHRSRGWPGKIDLVFVVRTPADIIFADELKLLSVAPPQPARALRRDA